MSLLGKRIIVLLMAWVLMVMVVLQVYDNVTGRGMPQRQALAIPTAEPTDVPDPTIQKLADLQLCVQNDPNNLQCMLDLAALYYAAGQYPQAQLAYERAVQLSPHDYQILLKLAGTYIFQLKFEQAATTLEEAATLRPDSPEIHLLLGLALSKLNPPRMSDALVEWNKVLQLAPGTKLADQAQQYINEAGSQ